MKQLHLFILLFLVITSRAFAQSQPITLDLSQPTNPESFTLDANNIWAETFNDVDYPFIEFNNSAFKFTHLGAGEGNSWGGYYWDGFTYSKNGDNADYGEDWIDHQWGNMAGGGIKTDADGNILKDENGVVLTDRDIPYLLAYWGFSEYTYPSLSVFFNDAYRAKGVYVNNSPWTYFANIHGDGFARALDKDGDYFKLFIHGLDENHNDNGQKVEYYLAKNENGTLIQSSNWEWIELSALGEIYGIYFTMESTDNDPMFGMNTASLFCMDKLQVYKEDEGIVETHHNASVQVYPNPTKGKLRIANYELRIENIEIYDVMGRPVGANLRVCPEIGQSETTIDLSDFSTGIYFIRIQTENGVITRKIIKN